MQWAILDGKSRQPKRYVLVKGVFLFQLEFFSFIGSPYEDCTDEISQSSTRIQGNMADIKIFSVQNYTSLSIQVQLEQITENVEIVPDLSKGLEIAIEYIKNVSDKSEHFPSCISESYFLFKVLPLDG